MTRNHTRGRFPRSRNRGFGNLPFRVIHEAYLLEVNLRHSVKPGSQIQDKKCNRPGLWHSTNRNIWEAKNLDYTRIPPCRAVPLTWRARTSLPSLKSASLHERLVATCAINHNYRTHKLLLLFFPYTMFQVTYRLSVGLAGGTGWLRGAVSFSPVVSPIDSDRADARSLISDMRNLGMNASASWSTTHYLELSPHLASLGEPTMSLTAVAVAP